MRCTLSRGITRTKLWRCETEQVLEQLPTIWFDQSTWENTELLTVSVDMSFNLPKGQRRFWCIELYKTRKWRQREVKKRAGSHKAQE